MYDYRRMTAEERRSVVEKRRRNHLPWHSPPHREVDGAASYLVTAACYEHLPIIGLTPERMSECEETILAGLRSLGVNVYAWCILPNHYHMLVRTTYIKLLLKTLGQFHGRSSFKWNSEDQRRGRQCWYNAFERQIRSDRHFFASLNYVHHNPVHHGYVEKWLDWPWSSAAEFIGQIGREKAAKMWREYPLLDYGKKWDTY
jgi:putative transposase